MEYINGNVKKRKDFLKGMVSYVEKEFSEVKELIRENCTMWTEDSEEDD